MTHIFIFWFVTDSHFSLWICDGLTLWFFICDGLRCDLLIYDGLTLWSLDLWQTHIVIFFDLWHFHLLICDGLTLWSLARSIIVKSCSPTLATIPWHTFLVTIFVDFSWWSNFHFPGGDFCWSWWTWFLIKFTPSWECVSNVYGGNLSKAYLHQ